MVIRPALDQELTVSESRPPKSKNLSPKPARPPARPSTQPGKRPVQNTAAALTGEPQKASVVPKPRQSPAPQPAADDPKPSAPEASGEETGERNVEEQPTQTPETTAQPPHAPDVRNSTVTTQPSEKLELAKHKLTELQKEAASEPQQDENKGKEVERAVEAQAGTDTETTTAGEETEQKNTGELYLERVGFN